MIVVNVPIEELESRYSAQWANWFHVELCKKGYTTIPIHPSTLRSEIKDGAFLDVVGTHYAKASQIQRICQLIDDGTIPRNERVVFLFQDGWFPVEQLAYIRDGLKCHDWRFVGLFHDGNWDVWDFVTRSNMYVWGEELENAWFKIYDRVVVASEYHERVLLETRIIPNHKIEVIPWKVEVPKELLEYPSKKENIVVFPHRLTEDKQPELFRKLIHDEKILPKDWIAVRTRDEKLDKRSYYQLLAKSKVVVSTALLEMFGISMIEAVMLGCYPIVPDRLAYREIFRDPFRYRGYSDLCDKLRDVVTRDSGFKHIAEHTPFKSQFHQKLIDDSFFEDLFDILETV
jgi:glycosyltransferase involved in cell wall biosynthesis